MAQLQSPLAQTFDRLARLQRREASAASDRVPAGADLRRFRDRHRRQRLDRPHRRRFATIMCGAIRAFAMCAMSTISAQSPISTGSSICRRRRCSNGRRMTTFTARPISRSASACSMQHPDVVLAHSGTAFVDERGEPFPFDAETGDLSRSAHRRPGKRPIARTFGDSAKPCRAILASAERCPLGNA